jgi:tRNA 2-thiouridine synthesizing protein A
MTPNALPEHHTLLDTQGLYCPEPVMLLHGAISSIDLGQTVKVVASDPSTQRDIPKFCQFLGHALLLQRAADNVFEFYVQKQGL